MKPERLVEEFGRLGSALFPDWSERVEWSVEFAQLPPGRAAECDHESHTIRVKRNPEDDLELYLSLVHEMAHAIAGPGHDERWQSLMRDAAKRARSCICKDLGSRLENESEYDEKDVFLGAFRTAVEKNAFVDRKDFVRHFAEASGMDSERVESLYSELGPRLERIRRRAKQRYFNSLR